MLVLSRKLDQEIVIGDNVRIRVLKVKGNTIRLGVEAPDHVKVVRGELSLEIGSDDDERVEASNPASCQPNKKLEKASDESAEITVCFDGQSSKRATRPDLIPFVSREQSRTQRGSNETNHGNSDTDRSTGKPLQAIGYRGPVPSNLQHNRLKELVKSLTRHQ